MARVAKSDIRFHKAAVWPIEKLTPNPRNARRHSPEQIETLRRSLREFGWTNRCIVDEKGVVLAGGARYEAAKLEGLKEVPVILVAGLTEPQKRALALADNRIAETATWDEELVKRELGELHGMNFDLGLTGFRLGDFQAGTLFQGPGVAGGLAGEAQAQPGTKAVAGALADKFFAVPFSVINAREGWWQERKRAWLSLGIQSELGRGENLLKMSDTALEPDPVKRKAMQAKRAARQKANGDTVEKVAATKGNGWGGGVQRRDAQFYRKKREWEAANGRKVSTTEFRKKHWDGYKDSSDA